MNENNDEENQIQNENKNDNTNNFSKNNTKQSKRSRDKANNIWESAKNAPKNPGAEDNNQLQSGFEEINVSRIITPEEIQSAPIWKLSSLTQTLLPREIEINAGGLTHGGRGISDGVTIFQIKSKLSNPNIFDVELNYDIDEESASPFLFTIYYQRETKSYFIRNNMKNKSPDMNIFFFQICYGYKYYLSQKEILSIGNHLLQIVWYENNDSIEIGSLDKDIQDTSKKRFHKDNKKEITFGREESCDFPFNKEKGFSRIQTRVKYDEEKMKWYLVDGSETKNSMNGTWILSTHSFQIYNGLIFEALGDFLKCEWIGETWQNDK